LTIAITFAGSVLILISLFDVFQTLFHPGKRGTLSDWIARTVWKVFRAGASHKPGILTYAGPFAILITIIGWAAMVWIGFALLYWPRLVYGFSYDPGIAALQSTGFRDAINVSLGTLITLSEGATPKLSYLRLLSAFESVIGFGLLTASVSWLLSVYPVLESRRSVAEQATLMHNAEIENDFDITEPQFSQAPDWLLSISASIANLRNQLSQFPIAYYFHVGEEVTSLSGTLSYLLQIAERATADSKPPEMRLAGTVLGGAVHNFLDLIAEEFLRMSSDDKHAVLLAYAHDQMSDLLFRETTIRSPRRAA
jgi:hypothetical protein